MTRLFSVALLVLMVVIANADSPAPKEKQNPGSTFDEIVVQTNLEVRRKSKENRQGKQLLSNEQSGTTSPSQKSTALASKPLLSDGSSVEPMKRRKRSAIKRLQRRALAKYLLRSRKVR